MKITILDITNQCPGRVIAVSDVHGHGHYLKGLLEQLRFSGEDTLVIVGDLIEKGGNSLETVRYVMQLQKENPHVYMTMGNVDCARIGNFLDQSEGNGQRFIEQLRWTKKVWKCGLFLEILAELGVELSAINEENVASLKARIAAEYRAELDFLWNLPTIITYGNYIFVHAGLPNDRLETLAGEDAFQFLKTDAFLEQKTVFERCVVVGHWPVCLYRRDIDCLNPIFDYERHVISIDGGCALKTGAQLNAVVIPGPTAAMQEIAVAAYDDYPVVYAGTAQAAVPGTICVKYFDAEVELLSETGDVVTLRHKSTGVVFDAPKKYLYHHGERLLCDDFINAGLEVQAGEALKLIVQTSAGAIVKKDGKMGWYRGELRER